MAIDYRIARIVFVQTGDFREASRLIESGKGETFHSQKYSMEVVERMAKRSDLTAVISISSNDPHDEVLSSGVRSIGLKGIWKQRRPIAGVIDLLDALQPTHLVLRVFSIQILEWARRRNVRILPTSADSIRPRAGIRWWLDKWRHRRLGRAMDHSSVDRVGNHNIAASEALAAIGVSPAKIVPWDWPRSPTPKDFSPRPAPGDGPKRLIFVGTVSEAKGAGDAVRALAADPGMGDGATLDVVGSGDIDAIRAVAVSLGVADRVRFVGRVPHAEVAPRMRAADAVIVYSRHHYGEGLPGTIYTALACRTPLLVSDHPMFVFYLRDKIDAIVVPEQLPALLAARLRELFADPSLYERLSQNSGAAFERIAHPVHWGEFIERWLRDSPEDQAWLNENSLSHWRGRAPGRSADR